MIDARAAGGASRRRTVAGAVAALVLAGCTGGSPAGPDEPSSALDATSPADEQGEPTTDDADRATPSPSPSATDGVPELAEPSRSASVWASTVGLPVVGAVRTSTPLARLDVLAPDEWAATCTQVAVELDTIAAPSVLTALAVTADQETATLLVGDLRAKADLLAVCDRDTPERDALVAEVADTHAVAVAWLRAIGGGS